MTSFSYSTIIEAPIETVFDYVSNIDNGAHWKETFQYGKKASTADMRYAAFERPHIFTEDITTNNATGVIDVKFAEAGNYTELSVFVTMKWRGRFRLLAPLANSVFKKAITKDFGDINTKLKSRT